MPATPPVPTVSDRNELTGPPGVSGHGSGRPRRASRSGGSRHYISHYHEGDDSLTTTLLSALAEVEDVDVDALPVALHDDVSMDAVERIVSPTLDGTPRLGNQVAVSIPEHEISLHGDGRAFVTDRSD